MRKRYIWTGCKPEGRGFVLAEDLKPKARMEVIVADRQFDDAVFSHADGKRYTNRKDWRDHLKRHGMVELGNDMPERAEYQPADYKDAIRKSIGEYNQGRRPVPVPEHIRRAFDG